MKPILNRTVLIGVGNKARQGKDQFTTFLVDTLRSRGVDARRYAFAEGLYMMARVTRGMTAKDAPLLQQLGMEYRAKDPDIWVNSCLWRISDDQPQVAIISDCRFWNEATAIKHHGGLTIRVARYIDGVQYIDPSRPADHPSETNNDAWDWDWRIENSGTLAGLKSMACGVAEQIDIQGLVRTALATG